ncbi:MAG: N-6 DNA methylase [Gemmataceae bacterium]|nr:N-6 DNA methylase [Gemmataceae bacterium]
MAAHLSPVSARGTARAARPRSDGYPTPPPVARFLCRRALAEYLITRLGDDEAARSTVEALFSAGDLQPRLFAGKAEQLRAWVLDCRVFDPAAGDGALLLAMLAEMQALLGRLDLPREPGSRRTLASCLYGGDIDAQALERCRARLAQAGAPLPPEHLVCADTLLEPLFGLPTENGGFDLVVANPPYVSFGLRGARAARRQWAEMIRARYPRSAEYKLSTYAVFMDRCLALTRPGGICCCLTPDSYLLGRYFQKLRRRLLDDSAIRALIVIEEDFWKGGVVGRPVIGVFRAGRDPGEQPTFPAMRFHSLAGLKAGRGESCTNAQAAFESLPRRRFRLFFSDDDRHFATAMEHGARPLGAVVSFVSGLIGRLGRDSIVADEPLGPTWRPGIDSGSDVLPYRVRYRGKYLNFSPAVLKSGFREARYEEPKILLRQTGDTLIAARDTQGLYCLNNVHVGNARTGDIDLRLVVAVLNSAVMARYYRLISLEGGRALAQVDLDVLADLPFKAPPPAEAQEAVALVAALEANLDPGTESATRQRLDEIVRAVYLIPSRAV